MVDAIVAHPPTDPEWEMVREIGERVGWHPEALRLAAIEGRETGWEGLLGELRAGHMPWDEVKRLVLRQWARLRMDERDRLSDLVQGAAPTAWLTSDDAARLWQVARPVAERRLWVLEHGGLMESLRADQAQQHRWRVAPVAHPILAGLAPG